ncbi:MAG: succinate dehydrogenase/fumarate reductase iron-sulfur subunit [Euryarchaeota archaeon]|nr:succinate dehydrogenase/fumarate reductase iron-sulfur subunit [Euryarchaeota archaeon]
MKRTLTIFRGTKENGRYEDYEVEQQEGMVVLDAIHRIQAEQATDLACRWNCKAGKCGSCSAEINGKAKLTCMTRMDTLPDGPIRVGPVKTFPLQKDLVTDVSWNYRVKKRITPFTPKTYTPEEAKKGEFNMKQEDIDRVQEFRKCIECFLCQNVCHVLRDFPENKEVFDGPRYMIRLAELEMHPKDDADRIPYVKETSGVGHCNITRCCTEVCPENIVITDNGIIPLKERMSDRYYDPLRMIWRKLTGKS